MRGEGLQSVWLGFSGFEKELSGSLPSELSRAGEGRAREELVGKKTPGGGAVPLVLLVERVSFCAPAVIAYWLG